ncbi:hypothetical protein [Streptomyces showdoensis]|uniref:Uncharacterized protein n=1 Tax=Streptomyces showdoensis TaxID=68268 RepID=A0A2P2GT41_STREW|nr:hypothetical protein [Streptomyces showdoensis]KKZ74660.1 hypothetical protein VO63_06110 [Streptomyces showdoensis]
MTATTLTPAPTVPSLPRARRLASAPLRAIRAFGGALVAVVVLGVHDEEAGVRDPRPVHEG